uniref:Uncharacterized protein n=1 Tax=Lotharella globosa TaxID=91324 RepID=A0A7S4DXU1_9EUKA
MSMRSASEMERLARNALNLDLKKKKKLSCFPKYVKNQLGNIKKKTDGETYANYVDDSLQLLIQIGFIIDRPSLEIREWQTVSVRCHFIGGHCHLVTSDDDIHCEASLLPYLCLLQDRFLG